MSKSGGFKPFPFFSGCHIQTLVASFITLYRDLVSYRRFVHLKGGERIALEITTPPNWKPEDPTIVMVHGFCGSSKSSYLVRIASKLYQHGMRTVRLNLRGCGDSKGYSKRMYDPEYSEDVWNALKEIKRDTPNTPLIVMGFSLGGNVVLKMAGERQDEAKGVIEKLVAINPPVDMYSSVQQLNSNSFYRRYFMKYLKRDIYEMHDAFDDLPPIKIPSNLTLMDLDELYLAPQAGYSTVRDYYYAVSSGPLLTEIKVPCHILFSRDDPIIDCSEVESLKIPDNVDITMTDKGGHLGFLGSLRSKEGFLWMDAQILKWVSLPDNEDHSGNKNFKPKS